MERRHSRYLAIALAMLLTAVFVPGAKAQGDACPNSGYEEIAVIYGTYPGSGVDVCSLSPAFGISPDGVSRYSFGSVSDGNDPTTDYPCSAQYFVYTDLYNWRLVNGIATISFHSTYPLSDQVLIRFIVSSKARIFFPPPVLDDNVGFSIEYYDVNGVRYSREDHMLSEYLRFPGQWFDNGYPYHYHGYWVQEIINTPEDQSEGYVVISFTDVPEVLVDLPYIPIPLPISLYEWLEIRVSSLQVAQYGTSFPEFCEVDVPIDNPTATPYPTATGAVPTPYPTVAGTVTHYPTVTPRPVIFPTTRPEHTPTPYPVPRLAPITWPTLAPIDTPEAVDISADPTEVWAEIGTRESDLLEMSQDIGEVATRWAGNTSWAAGVTDSQGLTVTGSISGTESISTTQEVVTGMVENVAMPVRFVKSVRLYMPNLWPLVAILLGAFLLAFSTVMMRLALTIGGTVVQIVRKLWEALPLN